MNTSYRAKYAQLKQDILGDGIKEGKLESYKKLSLALFGGSSNIYFDAPINIQTIDKKAYFERSKNGSYEAFMSIFPGITDSLGIPDDPNTIKEESPDVEAKIQNFISKVLIGIENVPSKQDIFSTSFTRWLLYVFKLISMIADSSSGVSEDSDLYNSSQVLLANISFIVIPQIAGGAYHKVTGNVYNFSINDMFSPIVCLELMSDNTSVVNEALEVDGLPKGRYIIYNETAINIDTNVEYQFHVN